VRLFRRGLVAAGMGWLAVASARGQAVEAPPARRTLPRIEILDPKADALPRRSPDITEVPPTADFLVIPLRVHILGATDLPEIDCGLTNADVGRIVAKVNGIWHKAGIHWALDPIVREPAAAQDRFKTAREAGADDALPLFKVLAPEGSRSEGGIDVYYIHQFSVNGVFLGDRTAFIQETAQLRPVEGGIDEPLPRVTAHELGHALDLPHRQDRINLLASGTTGTILNEAEAARARTKARRIPGALTVPEIRLKQDVAQARGNVGEAARLAAILDGLPDG